MLLLDTPASMQGAAIDELNQAFRISQQNSEAMSSQPSASKLQLFRLAPYRFCPTLRRPEHFSPPELCG